MRTLFLLYGNRPVPVARLSPGDRAFRIALLYLVIGMVWILASDHVLEVLASNSRIDLTSYQTFKGLTFVLVTAALFYYLIRRTLAEESAALEQLEVSEKRYRDLAVLSPVGIYHADAQGRITYVNPRLMEMCGLNEEDCLGDGWIESVHPEDREGIYQAWKQSINGAPITTQYSDSTGPTERLSGSWKMVIRYMMIGENLPATWERWLISPRARRRKMHGMK